MNSSDQINKKVVSLLSYQKEQKEKHSLSGQSREFFLRNMRNNKENNERESILRKKSNLLVLKQYKIKP